MCRLALFCLCCTAAVTTGVALAKHSAGPTVSGRPFSGDQILYAGFFPARRPYAGAAGSQPDGQNPGPTDPGEERQHSIENLIQEFMSAGQDLEGTRAGSERVPFPGPEDKPNLYQALTVTDVGNPLLKEDCRQEAMKFAVETLHEHRELGSETQAVFAADEHMRGLQNVIRESGGISYTDYLGHVAECREFCAPLVATLENCHVLSVARLPHTIVLFDFNRADIEPHYDETVINPLANFMRRSTDRRILLIGRASRIGDLYYNRRLAGQRTLAVRDRLQGYGVPLERIKMMWFGWEPPQISPSVAREYGLSDVLAREGQQRINQSVLMVLY